MLRNPATTIAQQKGPALPPGLPGPATPVELSNRRRDRLEPHEPRERAHLALLVLAHAHDQRDRRRLELRHFGTVRIDGSSRLRAYDLSARLLRHLVRDRAQRGLDLRPVVFLIRCE